MKWKFVGKSLDSCGRQFIWGKGRKRATVQNRNKRDKQQEKLAKEEA